MILFCVCNRCLLDYNPNGQQQYIVHFIEQDSMKKITIAFAWGGSWWHVYPIRSLLQHIDSHEEFYTKIESILWFGSAWSLEQKEAIQLTNSLHNVTLHFAKIVSWKLRREKSLRAFWKNFVDMGFRLPWWIMKTFVYLLVNKVDIIFCKWWHVAWPVILVARLLRIPIVVHESDTKPGLINKLAARYAIKKFTWFDNVFPWAITVGQILSQDMLYETTTPLLQESTTSLKDKIVSLHKQEKPLVFVSGWSQWGRVLYQTLIDEIATKKSLQDNYNFVIVMGFLNADYFKKQTLPSNILPIDYASQQEMAMCMYYSDLAILRGGTTTLAECKIYDLPLIIVPLPVTHDQKKNAAYYQVMYGDISLDQDDKNFADLLTKSILQYHWCKKKHQTTQRNQKISHAKDIIISTLVASKHQPVAK